MTKSFNKIPLQVAVGVIKNNADEILLSQRHHKAHQGGLWEFAGGKIEMGETAQQALARELYEELGITIKNSTPLITINHAYSDLMVRLHVFSVVVFEGDITNRENQALQWVKKDNLGLYDFPAANLPIITAVQLPPYYAILDDNQPHLLMNKLKHLLLNDITLIQARLKHLKPQAVQAFLNEAKPLCEEYKAILLLNSDVVDADKFAVNGLHLSSYSLMNLKNRPPKYTWLAASCHTLAELKHAQKIGVDFVVLSPVLITPTHPQILPLGWQVFSELVEQINLPVYALGGLMKEDLITAQSYGARGIAAIRAFL